MRHTQETDADITQKWAAGVAAAVIGAPYGVTKSAIIGRVHRLGLPKRQKGSPRNKALTGKMRIAIMDKADKGVPTETLAEIFNRPIDVILAAIGGNPGPGQMPTIKVPRQVALVLPIAPRRECQWITSEERPWTFCGCSAVLGKSWCPAHQKIVFLKRAA